MLREADDRRVCPRRQRGERGEVGVLGLLYRRVDGPAVRAAVRMAEPVVDPVDHLVRERVAELVGALVRLGARVAHEVGEEALDQPVLAHDALRPCAAGVGEQGLLARAPLDQPLRLEALEHLARRRARDPEHLGHPRGERRRACAVRRVLADRKGEEVDRLEVLVDGMSLRHRSILPRRRPVR